MSDPSECVRCFDGGSKPHSRQVEATEAIYDERGLRVPVCQEHFFSDLLGKLKDSPYRDLILAVATGTPGPRGENPQQLAELLQQFQGEAERRGGIRPDELRIDIHQHCGSYFLPPEDGETPAPVPEPAPQPSAPPLPAAVVKAERQAPAPKNKTAGGSRG